MNESTNEMRLQHREDQAEIAGRDIFLYQRRVEAQEMS